MQVQGFEDECTIAVNGRVRGIGCGYEKQLVKKVHWWYLRLGGGHERVRESFWRIREGAEVVGEGQWRVPEGW